MNDNEKIIITGSTSKFLGARLMEMGSILGLNFIGVNVSSPFIKHKLDLNEKDSVKKKF